MESSKGVCELSFVSGQSTQARDHCPFHAGFWYRNIKSPLIPSHPWIPWPVHRPLCPSLEGSGAGQGLSPDCRGESASPPLTISMTKALPARVTVTVSVCSLSPVSKLRALGLGPPHSWEQGTLSGCFFYRRTKHPFLSKAS